MQSVHKSDLLDVCNGSFASAALNVDPFEPHEFTDQDDAAAADWQQVAGRKLTKMCRAGIPEYFRGGVWNKVMSPTMEEAGTPSHKVCCCCCCCCGCSYGFGALVSVFSGSCVE